MSPSDCPHWKKRGKVHECDQGKRNCNRERCVTWQLESGWKRFAEA